jgi:hypothetical protein
VATKWTGTVLFEGKRPFVRDEWNTLPYVCAKFESLNLYISTVTSSDTVILSLKLSSMYSTFSENWIIFIVPQNFEVFGHTNSCVPSIWQPLAFYSDYWGIPLCSTT